MYRIDARIKVECTQKKFGTLFQLKAEKIGFPPKPNKKYKKIFIA